mmetsp:Transcript_28873/g.76177  ORF Transcript_28873/g.76177 Transcript_28873/m.76177 type:complete len:221 (-) Transcript_28873:504-1166(-)
MVGVRTAYARRTLPSASTWDLFISFGRVRLMSFSICRRHTSSTAQSESVRPPEAALSTPIQAGHRANLYCQGILSPSAKAARSSPRDSSLGRRVPRSCLHRSDSSPSASSTFPLPPFWCGWGTSQPHTRLGSRLEKPQGWLDGEESISHMPWAASLHRAVVLLRTTCRPGCGSSGLDAPSGIASFPDCLHALPARHCRTACSISGEARAAANTERARDVT